MVYQNLLVLIQIIIVVIIPVVMIVIFLFTFITQTHSYSTIRNEMENLKYCSVLFEHSISNEIPRRFGDDTIQNSA